MEYDTPEEVDNWLEQKMLSEFPILVNFGKKIAVSDGSGRWRQYHNLCNDNNIEYDWVGGRFHYQIAVKSIEDFVFIKMIFGHVEIDPASRITE